MMTNLSLFLLMALWGVNNAFVKVVLRHFSPLALNGFRFFIVSLVLFIVVKLKKRNLPNFHRDWPRVILVGILGNTVYQLLFIFGIHATLAGNTSLLLATTPIFTSLFSGSVGKEHISRRMWSGILASFLGVALIVLGGHHAGGLNRRTLQGDLMILTGAMVWSFYFVASKPLIRKYGSVAVTAATVWAGASLLVLVSIPAMLRQNWHAITGLDWGISIASSVFAIALAQIVWYRAIGVKGSARTAVYYNLVPVVGLFTAWPLLGETPRFSQIIGATAILTGTFFASSQPSNQMRRDAETLLTRPR